MNMAFRPHHFLCTLGFEGSGYSPAFIMNFSQIKQELVYDDQTFILVVEKGDSICSVCPHQSSTGCRVEAKIQSLDTRHAQILSLKPGDLLTWSEAKQRLARHMTLKKFHKACHGCEWKNLGICEAALIKLQNVSKTLAL